MILEGLYDYYEDLLIIIAELAGLQYGISD